MSNERSFQSVSKQDEKMQPPLVIICRKHQPTVADCQWLLSQDTYLVDVKLANWSSALERGHLKPPGCMA